MFQFIVFILVFGLHGSLFKAILNSTFYLIQWLMFDFEKFSVCWFELINCMI